MKRLFSLMGILCLCGHVLIAQSQLRHKVSFSTDQLKTESRQKESFNFQKLKMPDFLHTTDEVGKPEMPVKQINLLLPPGMEASNVSVEITGKRKMKLTSPVYPAQPKIPTSIESLTNDTFVTPDVQAYASDEPYPGKFCEIVHQGLFDGDKRILTLMVYPFQYLPNETTVEIIDDMELIVDYQPSAKKSITVQHRESKYDSLINNALRITVENFEMYSNYKKPANKAVAKAAVDPAGTKSITTSEEYIIITPNSFASAFDQFVAWKRRYGITCRVITIEQIFSNYSGDLVSGIYDNAGKIRQFLQDAYSNGAVYVLLGGDYNKVPVRYGYASDNNDDSYWVVPTDLYYSDLTGDWKIDGDSRYGEPNDDDPDHNPELYVGRILCTNTSEINKWILKLLKYEQNPGNFDNSYLSKAFIFESDEMQTNNQANNLATHLPGFNTSIFREIPSANSPSTPTFPKGSDVITEMNKNYGVSSWFGHGSPNSIMCGTKGYNTYEYQVKYGINGLENYDVDHGYSQIPESNNALDKLTNYDHPGVVYTIACYPTPFDDFNTPSGVRNFGECYLNLVDGGGPSFLGNTRYGWVTSSAALQNSFFDVLTSYYGWYNNAGYAEALSKVNYYSHYLSYTHNLIGCPETRIWTQQPQELSNVTITDNGNSLYVNSGGPVSRICVSSLDDGATYYEVKDNHTSHTFNTSVRPLLVTIFGYCNYLTYKTIVGGGAQVPYNMDFEKGLDDFWELKRSNSNGTVGVSMKNGPQDTRHLTMGAIENGTYVTNEAWLHVDLTGHSGYKMIFDWKDFGDETHTQDGIYFSNNGGANFTKVYSLDGGNYSDNTWRQFTIDISQLASNAGLSLTDDFIIKFQQYDNYAISTDGFAFDNIHICFTPTISGGIQGDGSICQYAYDAPYYISDVGDGVSYNWSFDF